MSFIRFPNPIIRTRLSTDNLDECFEVYERIKYFFTIEEEDINSQDENRIWNEDNEAYLIDNSKKNWRKVKFQDKKEEGWRRLTFEEFIDFYEIKRGV